MGPVTSFRMMEEWETLEAVRRRAAQAQEGEEEELRGEEAHPPLVQRTQLDPPLNFDDEDVEEPSDCEDTQEHSAAYSRSAHEVGPRYCASSAAPFLPAWSIADYKRAKKAGQHIIHIDSQIAREVEQLNSWNRLTAAVLAESSSSESPGDVMPLPSAANSAEDSCSSCSFSSFSDLQDQLDVDSINAAS